MRYARYALFLIPVAILVAWVAGIRGLTLRGIIGFALLIALVGGALFFMGSGRMLQGPYVPAHLEGTRVVPGAPR